MPFLSDTSHLSSTKERRSALLSVLKLESPALVSLWSFGELLICCSLLTRRASDEAREEGKDRERGIARVEASVTGECW